MIKGLIFDKDGTLFDFRQSWGGWVEQVLGYLTADEHQKDILAKSIGYIRTDQDFEPDSPVIAHTAPEIAHYLHHHVVDLSLNAITDLLNDLAGQNQMVEAVALRPLFQQFQVQGLKVGLATNDTEAPARAHLAAHGLTDFFDFIVGYDSGYGGKPAPGQLLAFACQMGLDPAHIAMVGDSVHDLEAGQRAGMKRVGVLTGIAGYAELAPHADIVLQNIGELPDWLAISAARQEKD